MSERGPDIVLEDVARLAGVAIGTLYRHFPTRQDLLEAVFLDETNELRIHTEELASAPVPFEALISWLRLQMDFAARGRSMGAAIMAAKHVPGTRIYAANKAMLMAGEVLLLRAQAAEQIRADVRIIDVVRLVYGIVMVNERASDPDGANRMLDLVIAGIRTKPSRD
ncbi:MAG TPA: TetR/AcrR family transcriptional regulator [Ktedonobacteraceae bacterium]